MNRNIDKKYLRRLIFFMFLVILEYNKIIHFKNDREYYFWGYDIGIDLSKYYVKTI